MRAGDLKYYFFYQEKMESSDGAGGFTETWADTSIEIPAEMRSLSAKERLQAGKHEHLISHRIFARWAEGVSTAGRLRLDDKKQKKQRYFEITSIILTGKRIRDMEILANEVNE